MSNKHLTTALIWLTNFSPNKTSLLQAVNSSRAGAKASLCRTTHLCKSRVTASSSTPKKEILLSFRSRRSTCKTRQLLSSKSTLKTWMTQLTLTKEELQTCDIKTNRSSITKLALLVDRRPKLALKQSSTICTQYTLFSKYYTTSRWRT